MVVPRNLISHRIIVSYFLADSLNLDIQSHFKILADVRNYDEFNHHLPLTIVGLV
jgi:hypothetical protein